MADRITRQLPPGLVHVLEPRHPSWWRAEAVSQVADAGIVLALVSYPGIPEVFIPRGPAAYLRLHGEPDRYASDYPEPRLQGWRDLLAAAPQPRGYVFFDNDIHVKSVWNAMRLQELSVERGLQPWQPETPWAPFPGWKGANAA